MFSTTEARNLRKQWTSMSSDLVKQAKNCNFCECMRKQLIHDRLVVGVKDASVRKLLLQKRDLTLEKAVDICRGAEATAAQLQKMNTEKEDVNKEKIPE